jgi:hypothetical protein
VSSIFASGCVGTNGADLGRRCGNDDVASVLERQDVQPHLLYDGLDVSPSITVDKIALLEYTATGKLV